MNGPVQEVLQSRKWPDTIEEYAAMMDEASERPVRFTNKGDSVVVLYNFYKMTVRTQSVRRRSTLGVMMDTLSPRQYTGLLHRLSPRQYTGGRGGFVFGRRLSTRKAVGRDGKQRAAAEVEVSVAV